jgi:hypothetical protein
LRAAGPATFAIDTEGSLIDTVLAVYTNFNNALNPCTFQEITCNDDGAADGVRSRVTFAAVPGIDYHVAVDGVNGEEGRIQLNWRLGAVPMILSASSPQTVLVGQTVELSVVVAGAVPPPAFQWWHKGAPLEDKTQPALTLSDVDTAQGGAYEVVVSNFMGVARSPEMLVTVVTPLEVAVDAELVAGVLQFHLNGQAREAVVLQATTNFLHWIPLFTNAVPNAPVDFMDTASPAFPLRFFRLMPWP